MRESAETKYRAAVEKTLSDLRRRLLGLETKFQLVLQRDVLFEPAEYQAEQLADRLLFCLAAQMDCTTSTLTKARSWFYYLFFYLLKHCGPQDRTFHNIIKISSLDQPTRKTLFSDVGLGDVAPAVELSRPVTQEQLELAVLNLLFCCVSSKVERPLLTRVQQTMRTNIV